MSDSIIQIKNVNKWFGDFQVLKDINLEVKPKEKIVVCGPSGSGKSTLIRCINRLEEHQQGDIIVDGNILTEDTKNIEQIRAEVGMVFQQFNLFPHLSIVDNCTLAPIWVKKMPKKEAEELALKHLERVQILDQAEKFPGQLSGGQQQRVAIARALAPKPEILLLDEPFSALDEELKETLMMDVKKLLKEEKITTIVITHNIKEAFQLSDKIAFLDKKKIMQCDTAYNLYHKPLTKEIAQFCGIGSFINGSVVDTNHVSTSLGILFGDTSKFAQGSKVVVMIRPDDIIHDDDSTQSAKVIEKIFHGSDFLYKLELTKGETLFCYTSSHHNHAINEVIGIKPEIDHLIIFG